MPLAALIPVLGMVVGDALSATGAVVNCYALHHCEKRSVPPEQPFANVIEQVKRDAVGPCNVPQYNFDQCQDQLRGVTVTTSIPAEGQAQFDNIPPACMNLAGVLTGGCGVSGTRPQPCGSACLRYTGLSGDDLSKLSQVLAPYAH
ncbi:hypothetical protein A9K55_002602 [Cordyceps militaris]|uniref:Uncharacterized protein n=1 Tax=Cordyceps militaris TaxID=73501 RepID=A0A2H4S6I9_CORMI|nr:hypothetical protein A9K55_002602 [Cordyceps militaris]